MSDWKGRLTQYQSFMESYLAGRFLNEGEPQQKLFEAMRYSLLAGGKRLRPVLVLESAHPSPLSAYRGFFGSAPFGKVNAFLKNNGAAEIDWRLPANATHG